MNVKIFQKENSEFIFEKKPQSIEEVQKNFKIVDDRKFYFKENVLTNETSILEHIYMIYNVEHPQGYKGRSLTCGDVVSIDGEMYFCAKFGWEKI